MKRSPEAARLEEILRSSKLVAGGFLGKDPRRLEEIVEADASEVSRMGHTVAEVAARMRTVTDLARAGLGTTVEVGVNLRASAVEAKGRLPCPWPHPGRFYKAVVTAARTDTGRSITWSDLNVHMIEAHGFFEGRGSAFRLEPRDLIQVLF